jgi:hypothetical protein
MRLSKVQYVELVTENRPDCTGELRSPVGGNHIWHSKPGDPGGDHCVCALHRCCAVHRDHFRPLHRAVDDCEYVSETFSRGWKRPHQVDVDA